MPQRTKESKEVEMKDLQKRLKEIIAEQLDVPEQEITAQAKFEGDLGADSLDLTEMIMIIEDEFGIKIPDKEAEGILTMQQAVDYLESKGIK